MREARATRTVRRVGYREEVFNLLKQARDLDVPNKDLSELCREAVACLGDFVGLTPTTFTNFPPNSQIWTTVLNPTGRLAAFVLSDRMILLREIPSGREVARLSIEHSPRSLCWNAAGDRLISIDTPNGVSSEEQLAQSVVHVWTPGTDGSWSEAEKRALPGAYQCLGSIKGLYFAVADLAAHSVQLLDAKTSAVVHRFDYPAEMNGTPNIALSPTGEFFAAETLEPRAPTIALVDIWDLASGQRAKRLEPDLPRLSSVSFSVDGKHLGCDAESGLAIYATDRFERVAVVREHVSNFRFAPDTTVIALGLSQQRRVRLWDWTRKEDVAVFVEPEIRGTAFAPNGDFLLTSRSRQARLYQLKVPIEKLSLSGHAAGVPGITFSPDGARLASVSKDRTVKVWDATTGQLKWTGDHRLPGDGETLSYSADGRWLVTAGYQSLLVTLWDAQTGTRLLEFGTNVPGTIQSVRFSPSGPLLATSDHDNNQSGGHINFWMIEPRVAGQPEAGLQARLVNKLPGGGPLVFAPDGRHLGFFEGDTAGVWDLTGAVWSRLLTEGKTYGTEKLSFTPDGRQLVSADPYIREVFTLEVATGKKVSSFLAMDRNRPTEGNVTREALSLSPNGSKLAIISPSLIGVELWDFKKARLLYSLPEQNSAVYWLAWSPDSQRLAVSRSNGEIAIWNLPEIERVLAGLGLSP